MLSSFAHPIDQPQNVPQKTKPLTIKYFQPLRKENKQLTKFDGNMVHYKRWAERITDYLARGRKEYPELLKTAAKHPGLSLKATFWG